MTLINLHRSMGGGGLKVFRKIKVQFSKFTSFIWHGGKVVCLLNEALTNGSSLLAEDKCV